MRVLEIIYAPFFPTNGNAEGMLVLTPVAASKEAGRIERGVEVIYALELQASAAPPTALPPFSAAIGSAVTYEVTLQNPTGVPATLRACVEAAEGVPRGVFTVNVPGARAAESRDAGAAPQPLVIAPFSSLAVPVVYTPSALGRPQRALLTFESPSLGVWEFAAEGAGTPPAPARVQRVSAAVGESTSTTVCFRNPFDDVLRVTARVSVSAEVRAEVATLARASGGTGATSAPFLSLLLGSGGVEATAVVPARGTLSIPLSFVPPAMMAVRAQLSVTAAVATAGPPLVWVFPLALFGEARAAKEPVVIRGVARRTATFSFDVPLPGLSPSAAGTPLTVALVPVPHSAATGAAAQQQQHTSTIVSGLGQTASATTVESLGGTRFVVQGAADDLAVTDGHRLDDAAAAELSRALTVTPSRTVFGAPSEPLRVTAQLHAMRPLTCAAELVIASRSEGGGGGSGRWRVPLRIAIVASPPDDELVVAAAIGATGRVSFSLTNPYPVAADFTATFSLDSAAELRISPARGTLPASSAAAVARGTGSDAPTATTLTVLFTPKDYVSLLRRDAAAHAHALHTTTDTHTHSLFCIQTGAPL